MCQKSWAKSMTGGTSAPDGSARTLAANRKEAALAVIQMQEVHKSYPGVDALSGVNLAVEAGEIVALLGPNGAGKTTTFELLLGLAHPTSGSVAVLGAAPGTQLGRIGAMLQSAGLPEQTTVRELVRLIGRSYPQALDVDDVLERTSLTGRATRTVTALSGGERQRLLLALALIGAPDLLLLDEPTAAMDVASRRAFWEQARTSATDGTTILFATHDLTEASAMAHRVVVIDAGRVVADSTPDELTHHGHDDLEEVFLALTSEVSTAFNRGA